MFHLSLSWKIHKEAMQIMNKTGKMTILMSGYVFRPLGYSSPLKNPMGMNSPALKCFTSINLKAGIFHRFLPSNICSISFIPSHTSSCPLIMSKCITQLPARTYCSALFITNDKLAKLCNNVSPTYDIAHVLENQENILSNLKQRHLDASSYNFAKIKDYYEKFLTVEKVLTELEFKVIEIDDYLQRNRSELEESQLELKTQERRNLKAQIRNFDGFIVEFQKNVVIQLLKLPNSLDSNTPDVYETIHEFDPVTVKENTCSVENLKTHVKFTGKLNINYLGSAAKFEFLFPIILKEYFITKHSFIPFTNTDICKGVIVEGTGTSYLCPYNNIVLANNELEVGDVGYNECRYHLVGSGHMSMFCAYHTNHSVNVTDLPVKYISSGKRYDFRSLVHDLGQVSRDDFSIEHLYNSMQKEIINIFIGAKNREDSLKEVDTLNFFFKTFLSSLNVKYRICRTPAMNLHATESARLEYQLYSNSLNSWVTCADICLNDDYISKRLIMCQHTSITSYEKRFLHVLNASFYVNVLLMNFIENDRMLDVDNFKDILSSIS